MSSSSFAKILPNDHVRGNKNAKITMIEYGDFECSYCREAFPIIESVMSRYKSDIVFAFRHFPLNQIHPSAQAAAQAAEAAGLQDRFWEMHAKLYQAPDLSEGSLVRIATSLGLDLHRFAEDFASVKTLRKIESDMSSGSTLGLKGTPSFYIDGQLFGGDWLHGGLEAYIESKLKTSSSQSHV